MNDTILLVGHGSRNKAGNREVALFAEQWRARHPDWRIELCFIEFAAPTLDEGLTIAAAHGGRVVVVPLILNAAGHVKMEIPAHIDKARSRTPHGSAALPEKLEEANRENEGASFVLARHLGACEPVFDIVRRRLAEADDLSDPAATGVILLGRGSSDRGANGEVAKLVRWLYETTPYEMVDLAFTGITTPRLDRMVERQVKLGAKKIVILPYYLFTGTLIERINAQVAAQQEAHPTIAFSLAGYLGFEDEIFAILDNRVAEAVADDEPNMMECDGCSYRAVAASHHLHDHDHHHEESHA